MRSSIAGSAAIHLVGLVLLFAVKYSAPLIIPGDVVQVSLADISTIRPVAPPPAPQPRDPEPEAPKVEPVAESGVKITEPKPAPKKPQEPEPQKRTDPMPESPQVPFARVGSAGLSGAVSVDQSDFAFTYYLILVRNKIAQVWTPPSGLVTGGQPVRAVIYFKIARDGTVKGVGLESPSGHEYFDRSALRAVQVSNPLPPLPDGFDGSDLGVHFGFEYGGP